MLEITTISLLIFSAMYIYLSFKIINMRRRKKISLFDGKDKELGYLIRAQGNLFEYGVLFLIFLFLSEIKNLNFHVTIAAVIVLFIGRFIHLYGFVTQKDGSYRVIGMQLTITSLLMIVGVNLISLFL